MKTILLAAGAAAMALSAGAASAAAKHSKTAMGPKQPIPYSQLNAYLKASPKQRASKDWWAGEVAATTGSNANTAATVSSDVSSAPAATPDATAGAAGTSSPATSATPPSLGGEAASSGTTATPSTPATPPVNTPDEGQVNPPAGTTPGAAPSTTPPK